MKKTTLLTFLILSAALLTSCENGAWNYPDYKYKAVYFAYQYPVRTIVLGKSQFDNTLDKEHQFKIMATTAGVYNNDKDIMVDFEVDPSLVEGFLFNTGGDEIKPMPDNYYNLLSDQMIIPKGELAGGVTVQLTDAFFDDPNALKKTYVIPIKMTSVVHADTILSGKPKPTVSNPRRGAGPDWEVAPKDFIFYAVKYINPWEGFYLRRGKDVITRNGGNSETIVRHAEYVVDDQVVELNTLSLSEAAFPVVFKDNQGQNTTVTLILEFDDQGNITISDNSGDYTATGSGKFVKDGAKDSWGGEDRNLITLDYQVDWSLLQMHVETSDTLVLRNRGVAKETFSPVLQ